jgi:putative glutamine amidotransferase
MPAPLIGITTHQIPAKNGQTGEYAAPLSYLNAVISAGGVPVLLPAGLDEAMLLRALERVDGLLLTGGGDIDPLLFAGQPHPAVYGIEPDRDYSEALLVRAAARSGRPFLGICRGIQVINVALGGSLYTHIADQLAGALKHDYFPDIPRDTLAHPVELEPGSRLADILGGERFAVNSLHHQGLERIAPDLRVTGRAPDGLVEAVELPDHPFGLGVQWHPEWLQEHAPQRALFHALVVAATK